MGHTSDGSMGHGSIPMTHCLLGVKGQVLVGGKVRHGSQLQLCDDEYIAYISGRAFEIET